MKKIIVPLALMAFVFTACTEKKVIPPVTPAEYVIEKNWKFDATPVWQDNFDGTGVDGSKWTFEVGGSGWGNNELQYYTSGSNSKIENGSLVIEARKEAVSGREYTSSRMVSKGKGDWQYGRFEVRAKLPKGRGTWPAIWMLPSENAFGTWPASGEVDIMEHVGYDPENINFSIHTTAFNHNKNTQKSAAKKIAGAMDGFHIYRCDWTPYAIRGFVDDVQYFEFINGNNGFTEWPFNKKFHMILNVAIGGNWGGAQGVDNTIFPARMDVDYVKVFKMLDP
jgi:beta-glucanase (GH16 family)